MVQNIDTNREALLRRFEIHPHASHIPMHGVYFEMEAALEATDVTNKFIYMAIIKIVYYYLLFIII